MRSDAARLLCRSPLKALDLRRYLRPSRETTCQHARAQETFLGYITSRSMAESCRPAFIRRCCESTGRYGSLSGSGSREGVRKKPAPRSFASSVGATGPDAQIAMILAPSITSVSMATRKAGTPRKNDPEGVRSRFLDVAADLFQNHGYCASGMQLIFEHAGVTAGAFYHHFVGKKDLALAVIEERVAAEVESTWMRPVREANTTIEGVAKVFKSIAAQLEERRAVRGCPLNNLTLELAFADAEFQASLAKIFDRWQREIEAKLRHDMDEGVLARSKPGPLAAYIIAVYSGAMALCKVHQSSAPLLQCLTELRQRLAAP